jgi:hypothetical protein
VTGISYYASLIPERLLVGWVFKPVAQMNSLAEVPFLVGPNEKAFTFLKILLSLSWWQEGLLKHNLVLFAACFIIYHTLFMNFPLFGLTIYSSVAYDEKLFINFRKLNKKITHLLTSPWA